MKSAEHSPTWTRIIRVLINYASSKREIILLADNFAQVNLSISPTKRFWRGELIRYGALVIGNSLQHISQASKAQLSVQRDRISVIWVNR